MPGKPAASMYSGYDAKEDATSWFVGAIALLACLAIAYLVFSAERAPSAANQAIASPHVKVLNTGGFGSGVYLGNGYILTASHVVIAERHLNIATDAGGKLEADVLWANDDIDVALLKVSSGDLSAINSTSLNCSPPTNGQAVTAYGSPEEAEFVSTAGRLVGKVGQIGKWKQAINADMTILPGMSGGDVDNSGGEVAGIVVGVMSADVVTVVGSVGVAPSGIGVVVPASAICMLMGRSQ